MDAEELQSTMMTRGLIWLMHKAGIDKFEIHRSDYVANILPHTAINVYVTEDGDRVRFEVGPCMDPSHSTSEKLA
jgi:hypothetical protein